MRWPGSWHRKRTPKLARIVALNEDAEIDLEEALERLREAAGVAGIACRVHGAGNGRQRPARGLRSFRGRRRRWR